MLASIILQQRLATVMPHNYGVVVTLRNAERQQQRLGRATVKVESDEVGMGVTLTQGQETLHIQLAADSSNDEVMRLGTAILNFVRRDPVPGYRIIDICGGYIYDTETGIARDLYTREII